MPSERRHGKNSGRESGGKEEESIEEEKATVFLKINSDPFSFAKRLSRL